MSEDLISRLKSWGKDAAIVVALALFVLAVVAGIQAIHGWGAADVQAKWDAEKQRADEAQRARDEATRAAERERDDAAAEREQKANAAEASQQKRIAALQKEVNTYARQTERMAASGHAVCALDDDGVRLWHAIGIEAGLYPASAVDADAPASAVREPGAADVGTPGRGD